MRSIKALYTAQQSSTSEPVGTVRTAVNGYINDDSYLSTQHPLLLSQAAYPKLFQTTGLIPEYKQSNTIRNQHSVMFAGHGAITYSDCEVNGTKWLFLTDFGKIEYCVNANPINSYSASGIDFNGCCYLSVANSITFISGPVKTFYTSDISSGATAAGGGTLPSTRWIYQNSAYWSAHTLTDGTLTIVGGTTLSALASRATYDISAGNKCSTMVFPISTGKIGVIIYGGSLALAKVIVFTVSGNTCTFDSVVDTNLTAVDGTGAIGFASNTLFIYGTKAGDDGVYALHRASDAVLGTWVTVINNSIKTTTQLEIVGKYVANGGYLAFNLDDAFVMTTTPTVDSGWTTVASPAATKVHPYNSMFAISATYLTTTLFLVSMSIPQHQVLTISTSAWAQGTPAWGGTENGTGLQIVTSIETNGSNMILASSGSQQYYQRSIDYGRSYQTITSAMSGLPAALVYWFRYGNGVWLCYCSGSIYYSTNGLTWTIATGTFTGAISYRPVWTGTRWVLGTGNGVFYSTTGAVWVACVGNGVAGSAGNGPEQIALNTNTGRMIRLTTGNRLQWSDDGITWNVCNAKMSATANWAFVRYLNNMFIAFYAISGGFALTSTDGINFRDGTWLQYNASYPTRVINKLMVVAAPNGGISTTGNVSYSTALCDRDTVIDVAYSDSKDWYYTSGNNGVISRCPDLYGYNRTTKFYLPALGKDTFIKYK